MKELTDKDRELLKHLAEGKTQKEVAGEVNKPRKAIENRLSKLRKQFNVKNTTELLLKLYSNAAI